MPASSNAKKSPAPKKVVKNSAPKRKADVNKVKSEPGVVQKRKHNIKSPVFHHLARASGHRTKARTVADTMRRALQEDLVELMRETCRQVENRKAKTITPDDVQKAQEKLANHQIIGV